LYVAQGIYIHTTKNVLIQVCFGQPLQWQAVHAQLCSRHTSQLVGSLRIASAVAEAVNSTKLQSCLMAHQPQQQRQ
jgi:hypothetical protein